MGRMTQDMNKDGIKVVKNSIIYEIRLLVDSSEKENYTKDEILKLPYTIARAKESDKSKISRRTRAAFLMLIIYCRPPDLQ